MHVFSKVLVILNLVICMILSQFVWISLAGNVQWRERYEWEAQARHQDKSSLVAAWGDLFAARDNNRETKAQNDAEIAALNSTKQALEAWKIESELARSDATIKADELMDAVEAFPDISSEYDSEIIQTLQEAVRERTGDKRELFEQRGILLRLTAEAHSEYANLHEAYLRIETLQFQIQEELEARLDIKARYRWLRPDLQRELGENGPVVFAEVVWVTGQSLQLNKGKRDGVELHQKYTIMRDGLTIAVVDVVELQNETCECMVVDLVRKGVTPKARDQAVTRMFMARVGSRLRDSQLSIGRCPGDEDRDGCIFTNDVDALHRLAGGA